MEPIHGQIKSSSAMSEKPKFQSNSELMYKTIKLTFNGLVIS